MRTLLLAATALIGVSAANANPPTAAPATAAPLAGRYYLLTCTATNGVEHGRGHETWTLGLDGISRHAEFWLSDDKFGKPPAGASLLHPQQGDADRGRRRPENGR